MKLLVIIIISLFVTELLCDEFAYVRTKNKYVPPFKNGQWLVGQGGDTPDVNHHMPMESQRFGVDLAMTKERSIYSGSGKFLSDYFSFGQAVTSPCDGKVIGMENSAVDNQIGESDINNVFGNYVIIDAGNLEYVVLSHFKQNSITVKLGSNLKVGDSIGLVGNSGNTTMPHIHMHIQNSPDLQKGHGLLFEFSQANGIISGRLIKNTPLPIVAGMWIENVKPE